MSRRDGWTQEARDRERAANRDRMRKLNSDPAYRSRVATVRKAREAERKALDPSLVERRRANGRRYFETRKSDPEFWKTRAEYLSRWRAERRLNEQFEAFLARIEIEETAGVTS